MPIFAQPSAIIYAGRAGALVVAEGGIVGKGSVLFDVAPYAVKSATRWGVEGAGVTGAGVYNEMIP